MIRVIFFSFSEGSTNPSIKRTSLTIFTSSFYINHIYEIRDLSRIYFINMLSSFLLLYFLYFKLSFYKTLLLSFTDLKLLTFTKYI